MVKVLHIGEKVSDILEHGFTWISNPRALPRSNPNLGFDLPLFFS